MTDSTLILSSLTEYTAPVQLLLLVIGVLGILAGIIIELKMYIRKKTPARQTYQGYLFLWVFCALILIYFATASILETNPFCTTRARGALIPWEIIPCPCAVDNETNADKNHFNPDAFFNLFALIGWAYLLSLPARQFLIPTPQGKPHGLHPNSKLFK